MKRLISLTSTLIISIQLFTFAGIAGADGYNPTPRSSPGQTNACATEAYNLNTAIKDYAGFWSQYIQIQREIIELESQLRNTTDEMMRVYLQAQIDQANINLANIGRLVDMLVNQIWGMGGLKEKYDACMAGKR